MAVVAAGCRSALVRLHGPFFSFLAQMGVCKVELTSVCCIFLVLPGNNKGYLKGCFVHSSFSSIIAASFCSNVTASSLIGKLIAMLCYELVVRRIKP